MFSKFFAPVCYRIVLYLTLVFSLLGCTSVVTQLPQAVEPTTPTPEIFNPLDPSTTPSDSTLPLTCQVMDLKVYVNDDWGYCFAYPVNFTADESGAVNGIVTLSGPPLDNTADPVRVTLEVTTQTVPEGSALPPLVNAYVSAFKDVNLPVPITWESLMLGGEPAEKLEPVPGQLSSRMIMALHENTLFTLRFHPSDIENATTDLQALTQTVTGSFAYLPNVDEPTSQMKTISWTEFGQNISLTYDSILAPWGEARTVPAAPVSDQILFSEAHPTYAQIRFLGFEGGRIYQLPILPVENSIAQVMVFKTSDFAGYGDDSPQGFINQLAALKNLLTAELDPARCAQPITGEPALPFLPWVNSKQSLCAHPKAIEFSGGKGIRYVTYYSQGVGPVLDQLVFYTFQGVTDDGQFYVSAFFPVQTGIFPMEGPPCPRCGEPDYDPLPEWEMQLSEQLTRLNAKPEHEFAPSLPVLDKLIESIRIEQR